MDITPNPISFERSQKAVWRRVTSPDLSVGTQLKGTSITESVLAPGFHTSAETPRLTRAAYGAQRFMECVPALLLVVAVVVPVTLLFISPVLAYVAFGGYLFFWGCQSIHLAIRQAREYRIMRRYKVTDWDERLRHLTDPYTRMHALADRPRLNDGEAEELVALNHWVHTGPDVPAPDEMRHLIVMPVANEDASIIHESLDELLQTDYRKDRVLLCLTFEERSEVWTPEAIGAIEQRYTSEFGMFMTTRHPDGLPGEGRVKGANISWGAQLARQELHRRGLRDEQIIVSAFDADTRPSHNYFQVLTYSYLTNPNRDIDSYQPVLLFHNNVWDVTTASRLVGYIASMWTLVDSTRPERLRIFSSHAMGMKALVGVNFWSRNVIPDDSRQFWRMFYGTEGRAKTVPLHVSVYLDGVDADGFWNTVKEQYRQIRRWAYGIIDFPYIMEQNAVSPKIPLGLRIAQTYRQISQFHLWAVVPLLLMTLRPVAGAVEPVAVHSSWMVADLAAVAIIASGVMSPLGLGISALVALKLLPVRPSHRPRKFWLRMGLEWLALPIVAPIFFCAPAIDSQVRLMARRYLGFRVTVKHRTHVAHQMR